MSILNEMILKLFSFIFLIFLIACENEIKTYELAMKNCENSVQSTSLINPVDNDTVKIKFFPESCIVGYKLPKFEVRTIDGNMVNQDSLLGNISIINFWFIGCPPCRAEIPGLNDIRRKFGSERINYLAIGNDDEEYIREFISENPFEFELVAYGWDIYRNDFQSNWGYPFTIVSNEDNVILEAFSGGRSDSLAIQEIMNKIEPILIAELNL